MSDVASAGLTFGGVVALYLYAGGGRRWRVLLRNKAGGGPARLED